MREYLRPRRAVFVLAISVCCALLLPRPSFAALSSASAVGVTFTAKGPGGISIVGQSAQLKVSDDGQQLVFVAPLSTLQSGIDLRDKHMKEKYLEVQKYPNAELHIARKAVIFPVAGKSADSKLNGELKLHGHTKAVAVTYTAKHEGSGFAVSASMRINMKDFGIEVPSYLGVSVKPDVDIAVHFHVAGS